MAAAVYTAGMDATIKPECAECDKEIDGEVVWYAPFSNAQRVDGQTSQIIATASSKPLDNGLPFHPKCYEYRTGEKWPQEENQPEGENTNAPLTV